MVKKNFVIIFILIVFSLVSVFAGGSCDSPGLNSFIIQNITGDNVAFINSTGDLCVEKGDCSDESASCNNKTRDGFVYQNSSGDNVFYIDYDGEMCLVGGLFEEGL